MLSYKLYNLKKKEINILAYNLHFKFGYFAIFSHGALLLKEINAV